MAERFSLPQEIDVLTGTGDNPATAISTGCLGRGYPVISLGTSGVFMMPVAELKDNAKGKMILFSFDNKSYSYLVQGRYSRMEAHLTGGVRIMEEDDFSKVDSLIDVEKSLAGGVIFYPHLSGERPCTQIRVSAEPLSG